MSDSVLTPEQILDAAEDALRRFGPAKANVVDVARALGVSHGSVYRHFASKAALRDAVAARWLHRIAEPLAAIAHDDAHPPIDRLRLWLDTLIHAKQSAATHEPEIFASYVALANESRAVIREHVTELVDQVAVMVSAGMAHGDFRAADPRTTAQAIFQATSPFHNPVNVATWASPTIGAEFEQVWLLLQNGLR